MKTITSVLVMALFMCVTEAGAAETSVQVSGEVLDGTFIGETGSGSVTFDDALLTGAGEESLTPENGLTLNFIIFGQTFFESDDIDYTVEPSLDFRDGVIVALDFIVNEVNGDTLTDIDLEGVFGFDMLNVTQSIDGGGEISIFGAVNVDETGVVPLPGALALFAAAIAGLGGSTRRRKRQTPP